MNVDIKQWWSQTATPTHSLFLNSLCWLPVITSLPYLSFTHTHARTHTHTHTHARTHTHTHTHTRVTHWWSVCVQIWSLSVSVWWVHRLVWTSILCCWTCVGLLYHSSGLQLHSTTPQHHIKDSSLRYRNNIQIYFAIWSIYPSLDLSQVFFFFCIGNHFYI